MSSTDSVSTTNLSLAAYLIVGGATLTSLEDAGKFTRVYLDTTTLSKDSLVRYASNMVTLTQKTTDSIASWEEFFDFSLLSKVDREYQQLKRLISVRRTNNTTRVEGTRDR